LPLSCGAC